VLSLHIGSVKAQDFFTLRSGCLTIVAEQISLSGCQALLDHQCNIFFTKVVRRETFMRLRMAWR
jgi:hypothetical protein